MWIAVGSETDAVHAAERLQSEGEHPEAGAEEAAAAVSKDGKDKDGKDGGGTGSGGAGAGGGDGDSGVTTDSPSSSSSSSAAAAMTPAQASLQSVQLTNSQSVQQAKLVGAVASEFFNSQLDGIIESLLDRDDYDGAEWANTWFRQSMELCLADTGYQV